MRHILSTLEINHLNQSNVNGTNFLSVSGPDGDNESSPSSHQPGEQIPACPANHSKIFIVHGHDNVKYELKNYLQNTLKCPEPIILSEVSQPGLTIIENFEQVADDAALVFVLVTPDDPQADSSLRARQNVIFELGYFLGKLGRKSGRVIILKKGAVEIPTDIQGILYIDIDHGIMAAGEHIRKAISNISPC